MVAGGDANFTEDAPRQLEASQGFALGMVGGRGVRWKAAHAVLKDRLACAYLMGAAAVANIRAAIRVLREAPCTARHMVVESVAYLQGAQEVPKEALHCAKDMVGGSAAFMMVVGYVQRVYMEAQIFVLPMVVERDVLCQAAQRVHVAVLIVVLDMVVENDASLKTVEKVPKVAQISAKLMVGESDVLGERGNVRNLQGVRVGYVLHTAAWFKSGRQTREVLSDLASSMGSYLLHQLREAVLIILPQELVLSLIASNH